MRKITILYLLLLLSGIKAQGQEIKIVFISDLHYGLTRAHFRGKDSVDAQQVNRAMIKAIRSLPVDHLDYIAVTGDIANRQEIPIQSDGQSWKQFEEDYVSLHIPLLLLPGNHDASNAIGYYKEMVPKTDASSMAGIYNIMIHPVKPKTKTSYDYATDKVNYSRNIGGIHFMFVNIWPDSANLNWMEADIKRVGSKTPVLIFAHDPPEGDPKHFSSPGSSATQCQFENLLKETYKDGDCRSTAKEQQRWCLFLMRHPNVKAYFHGHSNYNEFYTYKGVNNSLSLSVFRVDSPMKGRFSAADETLLSFQLIAIDPKKMQLTAREYLWNRTPAVWGASRTISLQ
jgi:hypothetical protein